jgi:hypothetical protein
MPRAALLLAGLLLHATSIRAAEPAAALDPARIGWTAVELAGSRFFVSASSSIALAQMKREDVEGALLTPPQGRPIAPGPGVIEMKYAATLTGQRTAMTLLLDPPTGASLQLMLRDSGRRDRQRNWRFTDIGAYQWTRRPADSKQESLPPEQWTDTSEGLRPYAGPVTDVPITDATGLIYVLAAAPLQARGDRYEILEFSRRQVHRVTAEVLGTTRVRTDYRERRAGAEVRKKHDIQALRIKRWGETLGPAGEEDDKFALLGLTDGIELAVDPATRLPLQLSGDAPYLGHVTLRLKSATLR